MCPLPDGYVIPPPYVIAPDGIHLVKNDGFSRVRVTWAWLFPVAVYVDPAGDQLVELAWRDRDRWVSRLIRRRITKSGRKLVAEAGDAGLPVIEAEARQAERWLAAAEAANHEVIGTEPGRPAARLAGRRQDVRHRPGHPLARRAEVSRAGRPARGAPARGHPRRLAGSCRGRRDYMVVQRRPVRRPGRPAARAHSAWTRSPSTSPAGRRGARPSRRRPRMSCWADPGDKADAMLSWQDRSIIPIEKRLNLVNGLVTVIDETRLREGPGGSGHGPVPGPQEPRRTTRRRLAEHAPVAHDPAQHRGAAGHSRSPPIRGPAPAC